MEASTQEPTFTFEERLDALRATKLRHTQEKWELIGSMDHDDWALILPPPEHRRVVETMSSSGMPITDVLLEEYDVVGDHPSGGFFGPRACGANFRALLEAHPVYIDPASSLAGAYMVNFMSYRNPHWNPDVPYDHLMPEKTRYRLLPGIGATQHFCQDLSIGLELGWGGILRRIRHFARINRERADFYAGLEHVVLGIQDWMRRHVEAAQGLAEATAAGPERENLLAMARINERLIDQPPRTFREVCQWILWYQITARMYNGSGSLGRLDMLLSPYYERERAAGSLRDEEAMFHIACLLLRDTAYIQLGGPDAWGRDATSDVSCLILEAAHALGVPVNVGVCVGPHVDERLLRRGVEILFEDRKGMPKFLGVENTAEGFARNGYPMTVAWQRAYSGCHWSAVPGREYTMNDCVKINLAAIFEVALSDLLSDTLHEPSMDALWSRYEMHLARAVDAIARGLDFHVEHMHDVFPELVLDLCSHGPIESGVDASHGGVEFINLCVDGAGLATTADSFAALALRVEQERRVSWEEIEQHLSSDWGGAEGQRVRLMMRSVPHYGTGGALADEYARRVSQAFTALVKAKPTPAGHTMIPGLFSWANTIPMGRDVGATPNGRHAGEPISHGANPEPGFRKDSAPTAMATAIAVVQPGYGNTAPMQIELDPLISTDGGCEKVVSLIKGHFALGGTQINMNVIDKETILAAHEDPSRYPDLVVRVTGFSAYFASLSPAFRQLVVDRIVALS